MEFKLCQIFLYPESWRDRYDHTIYFTATVYRYSNIFASHLQPHFFDVENYTVWEIRIINCHSSCTQFFDAPNLIYPISFSAEEKRSPKKKGLLIPTSTYCRTQNFFFFFGLFHIFPWALRLRTCILVVFISLSFLLLLLFFPYYFCKVINDIFG